MTDTPAPYRWRWAALFVVLAAEVMDLLDSLVTNIAAPAIRADIGGGESTIQWLGAAYTLAMAIGLITGGRLGDIFGRRRMYLVGAVGFTLGSVACGLAQAPDQLIAARVVQGLLGAIMLPQGLGILKEIFSEKEQAAAFGMFGPVMGLSTVGGPILAGWLVDADLWGSGWRMIFLINIPLGLFAVAGGLAFLPEWKSARTVRLDLLGALLAAAGSALIVFPLVQGREHGWPAWAFALIALAVAVFAVFAWYEKRTAAAGRDPLVEPSLFRKRGFSGGMALGLVFFSAMTGFWLTFSLYTQIGLHYSPFKAGLAGIPSSIGMVVAFIASQALAKFGRKVMHGGLITMVAGVGGVILTLGLSGDTVTPWQLTPHWPSPASAWASSWRRSSTPCSPPSSRTRRARPPARSPPSSSSARPSARRSWARCSSSGSRATASCTPSSSPSASRSPCWPSSSVRSSCSPGTPGRRRPRRSRWRPPPRRSRSDRPGLRGRGLGAAPGVRPPRSPSTSASARPGRT
ncbi:hypothetical protein GCM10025734_76310 [Kitasatospora paranensis]|uniref:MFS transporter n=1 Tax=Kitasatospora paranensis TaxID=258053 RepID=UPI0031EDC745